MFHPWYAAHGDIFGGFSRLNPSRIVSSVVFGALGMVIVGS